MNNLQLTLFIAGRSDNSKTALMNLNTLKANLSVDDSAISIIDVIQNPDQAEEKNILFTPLLEVKTSSFSKTIVGNLSDIEKITHIINSTM